MNKNITTARKAPILLALVALSLFAMACNRLTEFTITLKPPRVLQVIQTALDIAQVDVPIEDLRSRDLRRRHPRRRLPHRRDGKTTTGTVDLALGTEDGALKAEIVNEDIEGVNLTAEQIAGYNELLSREFNRAATSVPGVRITSVETVEGAVKVRVKLGLGG